MSSLEIKKGIYWVGAVDWSVRNFHGYLTENGTTYNAYLVVDEKIVLIDTVKKGLSEQLLFRLKQIIDPAKIDYVLSNHSEPDHSGAISAIMETAPNATIIVSKKGEAGLNRHYKKNWKYQIVKTGDSISLGSRTLQFVNTPMVHWPDSMVTYMPEEKILFSNDAFGQHIATPERFDDEIGWSIAKKDAAKYYANIVLPFDKQVNKALEGLSNIEIDMICPSHGLIWRSYVDRIVSEYSKWANSVLDNRALIVYDSMWHSTEAMAWELECGLSEKGVPVTVRELKVNHISDIMTDLLYNKMILLGSPTLNNGILPTMGKFLTYVKGLRPKNRIGYAFGSYGWGGQSVSELEKFIEDAGWGNPVKGTKLEYVPEESELDAMRKTGNELADILLAKA
jgi:flavorubredoxin